MNGPIFRYDAVELNWFIFIMCMVTAHWVMSRINIIWQNNRSAQRSRKRKARV
jgi:hypothetical protein